MQVSGRDSVRRTRHDAENFIAKSPEEHDETIINSLDDQTTRATKDKLKEELRKKERTSLLLIVQRVGNEFLEY